MHGKLEIGRLVDHMDAIPVLKDWFEKYWAPYYGPNGPGDAEQDLRESCNHAVLPLALVAYWEGELCGTAALKWESVSTHRHLGPWLAALVVHEPFRRRGVAAWLIAAIEDEARALGFSTIFVGTGQGSGTPESTIRKRGWEFLEMGPYFVSQISIFKKAL